MEKVESVGRRGGEGEMERAGNAGKTYCFVQVNKFQMKLVEEKCFLISTNMANEGKKYFLLFVCSFFPSGEVFETFN